MERKILLRFWAVILLFLVTVLTIVPSVEAKQGTNWEYEGVLGPDHWGQFAAVCETGKNQSPLNIQGDFPKIDRPITVNYQSSILKTVNTRHTIQIDYDPGSTITIENEIYDLLQFHFHRPSEEEINGQAKAMVIHFVHKSKAGKLLVIGVLVEAGQEDPTIRSIWAHLPQQDGEEELIENVKINAADLLPTNLSYYYYIGSLTTPPCTEDVAFYILQTPIEFSSAQLAAFPFQHNARPVQSRHDRQISAFEATSISN